MHDNLPVPLWKLHPLQCFQAEQVQAGFEDGEGAGAEEQAAVADWGFVDDDLVGVVEGAEGAG
jgi:hypothetical protein